MDGQKYQVALQCIELSRHDTLHIILLVVTTFLAVVGIGLVVVGKGVVGKVVLGPAVVPKC